MISAYVFQHRYTGVQIFVFHCERQEQAYSKMVASVPNSDDFMYLGEKTVLL